MKNIKYIDKKIVLELYNFTLRHKFFHLVIKFIINISSYVFFLLFIVEAAILVLCGDFRVFKFASIVIGVIFFNMFLRKVINRKRPFDVLGIKSLVEHKSLGSFPSNHSASSMIIAVAFMYLDFNIGFWILFMALITGISRVFAGLHYVSDVIGGFFVGAFLGCLLFFMT